MEPAVFLITPVLRGKGKALGKNNAANALWDKKQFPGRELMTFRKSIDPNKTHTHTIWKLSTKLRDGKIGHNLRIKSPLQVHLMLSAALTPTFIYAFFFFYNFKSSYFGDRAGLVFLMSRKCLHFIHVTFFNWDILLGVPDQQVSLLKTGTLCISNDLAL